MQHTKTYGAPHKKAALLRIALSGHVEFLGDQQQSLDAGSRLGALQGEEV